MQSTVSGVSVCVYHSVRVSVCVYHSVRVSVCVYHSVRVSVCVYHSVRVNLGPLVQCDPHRKNSRPVVYQVSRADSSTLYNNYTLH